jgi:cytidine deaminase
MNHQDLLQEAIKARNGSYSPYSKFAVGAAILAENGTVYTGANVENASFGLTICAERSAALKAVNDGQRRFLAVACVGG